MSYFCLDPPLLKTVICNLGANAANQRAIDRYCHALVTTQAIISKWDQSTNFITQSGRHVVSHAFDDMKKVIKVLLDHKALHFTPGRKYKHHRSIKSSFLAGLDINSIFKWIEEHKKLMRKKRAAR